jgi:hypothetical protein
MGQRRDADLAFVVRHARFRGVSQRRGGGWVIRIRDDGHEMRLEGDSLDQAIVRAAAALRRTA